jgi:hypothetical protein
MSETVSPVRDDRVQPYTRGVSLFIVPFLLAAFGILYLFPDRTAELFAWPIAPSLTSRVLASAYLGGAYFFLRVVREQHWNVIKNGFVAVVMFATLLGIATVMHWERFTHDHVSFWAWAALYFLAPFLVLAAWVSNRRYASPPGEDAGRLSAPSRKLILVVAVGGTALGLVMFVVPEAFIPLWPWDLTPLTCRVIASVLCLASAGVGVWRDPRWSSVQRLLEVALVMLSLMLLATVLGRAELDAERALFWPWWIGLIVLLAAVVFELFTHRVGRPDRSS